MARAPSDDYEVEIESDRDIRKLSDQNSKLSGYFFIIAAVFGVLILLYTQLRGGEDKKVVEREVFRPPAEDTTSLPEIQEVPLPPVQVTPEPMFDPMELERLKQFAILEEQRLRNEQMRLENERQRIKERRQSEMVLYDGGAGGVGSSRSSGSFSASGAGGGESAGFTDYPGYPPELAGLVAAGDPSAGGGDSFFGDDDVGGGDESNELYTEAGTRFQRDSDKAVAVEAQAVRLKNQDSLITQGSFISGILETAIHSDLPGMVRAIVDENVYSRTGRKLLIPKGTRVVGRYQSGAETGQTRVYIAWSRLERPDGVIIDIDSPGTDSLGRAGLTGIVDKRMLEKYGAATFMTLLSPAILLLTKEREIEDRDTRDLIAGGRESTNDIAEGILRDTAEIGPVIHVQQGTEIVIFVARDLSFHNVETQTR